MKPALKLAVLALGVLALGACANRPPAHALDRDCEMGGRHGPTGVLEYQCTDGDGVVRERPQPIHRVISGGRSG
ncbi:hypothetical protein X907_1390 [Glycocaulis alkaliphilus]|uniref:Uncharacterized protein n=1 Tax=Glycocaulis alkaliphilus TaxID=1434191 RepID=A0A3T0E922_9PROT|nr:hypothetical protein [Glycocaulis alkaliphilus]AZU03923.1 hypothetical protein X907_1390 [Glycocaulis alkaliphilus]GGB86092.1 hypothetical protein GCM10007417_27670 [Glycocaulis alkaliphilus]